MKEKITKRLVDSLQLPEGATESVCWDSELTGFGIKVTPTGKKYIVKARVNGKQVKLTLGKHGPLTPDQARDLAKIQLGQLAAGVDVTQVSRAERLKGVTLQEAFDDYLKFRRLSARTVKDYTIAIEKYFRDWRDKPLLAINRTSIEQRFDKLSAASPAQANQAFRFLRALLNYSMERFSSPDGVPLFETNPCNRLTALKRWNKIQPRKSCLTPSQLTKWFAVMQPHTDDSEHIASVKDCCILLLLTGFRDKEGSSLRWENVDLSAKQISLLETKNHVVHTLPIGEWLAALLTRRKQKAKNNAVFVFAASNKHGYLHNHRQTIQKLALKSDTPFTLHDLRRTFASLVNHHLGRSLSNYTIKRLLNHSSGGDVTAGYIQFGVEDLREPMQLLENYVLKCAGILTPTPVVQLTDVRRQA